MFRPAPDRRAALEALIEPERWLRDLTGSSWRQGLRAAYHLRRIVLEHEERHARNARDAGMPWWEIGYQLGVSTQAAHRRWARFVGRPNAAGKPTRFRHD